MTVNNIFNIKINEIAANGSVNFGNTIHKGHVSDTKAVGTQSNIGDAMNTPMAAKNAVFDPDILDQPKKQV